MSALLIVEDEPHIASGLRFNLEAEGHAVTLVESGEAATPGSFGSHTDSPGYLAIYDVDCARFAQTACRA